MVIAHGNNGNGGVIVDGNDSDDCVGDNDDGNGKGIGSGTFGPGLPANRLRGG